jgi:hypothetical protein
MIFQNTAVSPVGDRAAVICVLQIVNEFLPQVVCAVKANKMFFVTEKRKDILLPVNKDKTTCGKRLKHFGASLITGIFPILIMAYNIYFSRRVDFIEFFRNNASPFYAFPQRILLFEPFPARAPDSKIKINKAP